MTMSVYIIFPDLGKHKIAHFFVGLSLPTPCALYSLSTHALYIWYTHRCAAYCCVLSQPASLETFSTVRGWALAGLWWIWAVPDGSLDQLGSIAAQRRNEMLKVNKQTNMLWRCPHKTWLCTYWRTSDGAVSPPRSWTPRLVLKGRNPLGQHLAPEPRQSQALLPTELPPRRILACLCFSYLCWAVCTIP